MFPIIETRLSTGPKWILSLHSLKFSKKNIKGRILIFMTKKTLKTYISDWSGQLGEKAVVCEAGAHKISEEDYLRKTALH